LKLGLQIRRTAKPPAVELHHHGSDIFTVWALRRDTGSQACVVQNVGQDREMFGIEDFTERHIAFGAPLK
jgi:hypothetical protein